MLLFKKINENKEVQVISTSIRQDIEVMNNNTIKFVSMKKPQIELEFLFFCWNILKVILSGTNQACECCSRKR